MRSPSETDEQLEMAQEKGDGLVLPGAGAGGSFEGSGRGMSAFMIITLPLEEEMTVDVARSGMPSWGLPDIVKELGSFACHQTCWFWL